MNREDPLSAIRGICWALPLSIVIWIALAGVAVFVHQAGGW